MFTRYGSRLRKRIRDDLGEGLKTSNHPHELIDHRVTVNRVQFFLSRISGNRTGDPKQDALLQLLQWQPQLLKNFQIAASSRGSSNRSLVAYIACLKPARCKSAVAPCYGVHPDW